MASKLSMVSVSMIAMTRSPGLELVLATVHSKVDWAYNNYRLVKKRRKKSIVFVFIVK